MLVDEKTKPLVLIFQHIYIKLNKYDHTINLQYLTECSCKVYHSVTKSIHKMCKLLQSSITSQTIAMCAISQAILRDKLSWTIHIFSLKKICIIQANFFKQVDEESYLVPIVKSRIRKDKFEPRNKQKSRHGAHISLRAIFRWRLECKSDKR